MRVLLIFTVLLAAAAVTHGMRRKQSADEAETRGRMLCVTSDGLDGVCRRQGRCPPHRMALTSTQTVCPGGRRRRKTCCPFRQRGGGRPRPEESTESPAVSTGGGFNTGGGTTGGSSSGGSPGGGGFSQGGHPAWKPPARTGGGGGGFFSGSGSSSSGSFGVGSSGSGSFGVGSSGAGSFGGGTSTSGAFVMRPSGSGSHHAGSSRPGPPSRGSFGEGSSGGSSGVGSFGHGSSLLGSSRPPSLTSSGSLGSFGGGFSGSSHAGSSNPGSSNGGSFGAVSPSVAPGSVSSGGSSFGGSQFGGGSFVTGGSSGTSSAASTTTSPSGGGFSSGVGSSGGRRPSSGNGSSSGGLSSGSGSGVSGGGFSSGGGFVGGSLSGGGGASDGGFNGDSSSGGGGGIDSKPAFGSPGGGLETATSAATVSFAECGRPTPTVVWLRQRRAAPASEATPGANDTQPTPGPFQIRVVGGKNAEIGKWPWIALIGHKQGDKPPFWFCGGTLIDKQNILTAAHCLKPRAVNPATLVVRLGEYDTSSTTDGADPQDYGVSSFTNHKDFAFPVLHDDISLVHLTTPVEYTNFIKPICLPSGPSGDYAGTRIDVAGWGYTEFGGESSSILQEVDLPVVSVQECQSKYESSLSFQNQFPGGFGDNKLCAGETEGGKDACQGDSGGPMVHQMEDGRYEQVGVVSAGVGCGSPGFPGVYTRVSAYLDWIRQNKK